MVAAFWGQNRVLARIVAAVIVIPAIFRGPRTHMKYLTNHGGG
jgi:hypothetical protein